MHIYNLTGALAGSKQEYQAAIAAAVETLAAGGLIIFPTETVYGAGVDATNQEAVDLLLAYKSRREGKPLSIAVTSQEMAAEYVELNEQARALYEQFLPGPVTVVSKDLGLVAAGVASEFGTLGTRIPDYPFVLDLVRAYSKPITATSANASGKKRPYSIADILDHLSEAQKSRISLVFDAGTLPKNEPSVVIDTTLSTPVVLRERGGSGALGALGASSSSAPGAPSNPSTTIDNDLRLISRSPEETKAIAGRIILKNWNAVSDTGLVIGLSGPLGAGKTVFAHGVAEFLGITEPITSPTYSYREEYDFTRHQTSGILHHLDLWKVDSPELYNRLEITQVLNQGSVVLVEWWQLVDKQLSADCAQRGLPLITIDILQTDLEGKKHTNEHYRTLIVNKK